MTDEIIDASQKTAVVACEPFYAQLAELEKDNSALAFNYESKQGNKEARSHVNKLRLTSGALERTRVAEKAESLRIGRAIDSEAKEIKVRIEAMIDVHQVKLDEIEQREKDRIAAIRERLDALAIVHADADAANLRFHIETLEAVSIDEKWAEFVVEAKQVKDAALAKHSELLDTRIKADAEAAELERLRAEEQIRVQKAYDEAIAAAAVEQEKKRAQAAEQAAAEREQELRQQAENAERRRIEQEEQSKRDAAAAAERAENARLQAIQDEKDRVAREKAIAEQAAAERAANTAHLKKINGAALAALVAGGIDEEVSKAVIKLIAQGKIPAVTIEY